MSRRTVLRQAEAARLLHIDRDILHEQVRVVGEKPGGQPLLGAAVGHVAHHRDAKMRLARMRLERRGDRVEPRHHRRQLRQKRRRRLEPRLIELPEDVHVVAAINVFAQSVAVIHQFHQPVALFPLRNALRQGGHHLPVGPVHGVIPQQRLAECGGLAPRVVHFGPAIETQQADHLLHQLRRMAAKNPQRVPRPVGQAAPRQAQHEMPRVLQ